MRHLKYFSLFFSVCLLLFAGKVDALEVTNYEDGTTISYPTALIYGTLENAESSEIQCENLSSQKSTRILKGSAFRGRFKVLAELVPGENELLLKSGSEEKKLKIKYQKNENPLVVRFIYMTDSTGERAFQTPKANDPMNVQGKLDTAAKLMQTFTAERMNDMGYGRKTFNLELDADGNVIVHFVKGKKTAEEYVQIQNEKGDNGWFFTILEEIKDEFPMDKARNLVIPAYSRFIPETGKTSGHTALGSPCGLALFGSGNIFTWPDSLNEVVSAFEDSTPIDRSKFQDDSVGRSCFWGVASTTMGAALHEIGHTLDLPHSLDREDLMLRGHDRFNRAFLTREAPSAQNPNWYEFRDDQIALWGPKNAPQLNLNPYLQPNAPKDAEPGLVKFEMNHQTSVLTARAENGIGMVACFADGSRFWIWTPEKGEKVTEKTFNFWEVANTCPSKAKIFEFLLLDVNYSKSGIGVQVHRPE